VPTPGRLPSNEPAIEGPSITKAKATMKLVVRIRLSPGWLPFLLLHNPRPFPEFCSRRENGFVAPENCFVVAAPTKQSGKKFNNFNQTRYSKNVWNRGDHVKTRGSLAHSKSFNGLPRPIGSGFPGARVPATRVFPVEKPFVSSAAVNRNTGAIDLIERHATFLGSLRCDVASTKDNSRGQWQHRCWQ
jgi:hypothetical protein